MEPEATLQNRNPHRSQRRTPAGLPAIVIGIVTPHRRKMALPTFATGLSAVVTWAVHGGRYR